MGAAYKIKHATPQVISLRKPKPPNNPPPPTDIPMVNPRYKHHMILSTSRRGLAIKNSKEGIKEGGALNPPHCMKSRTHPPPLLVIHNFNNNNNNNSNSNKKRVRSQCIPPDGDGGKCGNSNYHANISANKINLNRILIGFKEHKAIKNKSSHTELNLIRMNKSAFTPNYRNSITNGHICNHVHVEENTVKLIRVSKMLHHHHPLKVSSMSKNKVTCFERLRGHTTLASTISSI